MNRNASKKAGRPAQPPQGSRGPQQQLPQQSQPKQQQQQQQQPQQLLKKSPPPAIPMLKLRPQNNGLLTTIEQAAMSDEEPSSPINLNESMRPGSSLGSRIPTPNTSFNNMQQPNYENVVNTKLRESPSLINSMIPIASKKTSLPNDRISTANFVQTPIRKASLETAKRIFPTSGSPSNSVISPLARPLTSSASKIPTPSGMKSWPCSRQCRQFEWNIGSYFCDTIIF